MDQIGEHHCVRAYQIRQDASDVQNQIKRVMIGMDIEARWDGDDGRREGSNAVGDPISEVARSSKRQVGDSLIGAVEKCNTTFGYTERLERCNCFALASVPKPLPVIFRNPPSAFHESLTP